MRLLAIDPGSISMGWSIFVDGKLRKYGALAIDDPTLSLKLTRVNLFISGLINDHQIDSLAAESTWRVDRQTIALGAVAHEIRRLCVLSNMPYFEYKASQIRSHFDLSKGRPDRDEGKARVKTFILSKYKIPASLIQDIYDSIIIGRYHWERTNGIGRTVVPRVSRSTKQVGKARTVKRVVKK